jgi:hypothetical protein
VKKLTEKEKGGGAEYVPGHVENVSVWNGLLEGVDLLLWDAPARHIVNHLLGHPQTGRRDVPVHTSDFYNVEINFMMSFMSCLSLRSCVVCGRDIFYGCFSTRLGLRISMKPAKKSEKCKHFLF